jgi:hypothetical protein
MKLGVLYSKQKKMQPYQKALVGAFCLILAETENFYTRQLVVYTSIKNAIA